MKTKQERTQATARQALYKAFHGEVNFMTPTVIRIGWSGDKVYELASGTFIRSKIFYGVSVVSAEGVHCPVLSSGGFDTLVEAEAHIEGLSK